MALPEGITEEKLLQIAEKAVQKIGEVYESHKIGKTIAHITTGRGKSKKTTVLFLMINYNRGAGLARIEGVREATQQEAKLKHNPKDPVPCVVRI